ncbi:hypothetical protein [Acinetobacter dispersus]|uniref:hypothetical protein n=1 Tax=Acinetobacter dispersus TaxID=70348 RepID=UPI00132EBD69|nr:hypothetical protein [Acinetobacter dispersus]QHH99253.1 hypothetical protein FPL17_17570 [Acinetobacter dispersus]
MIRKVGKITIEQIRDNAPEGANLFLDLGDDDLVHEIVYYKLHLGYLTFFSDHYHDWSPCMNPAIVPKLKSL